MTHYMRDLFGAQTTIAGGRIRPVGMSDKPNRIPFGGHASSSSLDVVAASILEDEAR